MKQSIIEGCRVMLNLICFIVGLWAALCEENPDRKVVQRLLRQWCRLTCVKNGKVVNIKSLVKDDIHKVDLLRMIEEFENQNEMCLALNAGFGFIVKSWVKQGNKYSFSQKKNQTFLTSLCKKGIVWYEENLSKQLKKLYQTIPNGENSKHKPSDPRIEDQSITTPVVIFKRYDRKSIRNISKIEKHNS